MNKNSKHQKIANFLYELGTMRKIARSHRQTLLTNDLSDNIASHSYRVTAIGWFLAKLAKADAYKVLLMCLFHDAGETRTGDQNWVHKKYIKAFDKEVAVDQLSKLSESDELLQMNGEYEERKSLESKIAKDADFLDQILLLKEYSWQGNQEAALWLKDNEQFKRLHTKEAAELAKEIMSQKPSDWWGKNGWTPDRRT